MGFFDILKKGRKGQPAEYVPAKTLNGFTPIFSQFGDNVYKSDVVRQAISCIAREISKLEPQHIRETKSGAVIPENDRIQAVLMNPNPLMSTADMLEKIVWQLMLHYNSFILPTYDKKGELDGLYPLQPVQVDFLQDGKDEYFIRLHFANNYKALIKYSDIIHIRNEFGINEFMGGGLTGEPEHDALLKTLELNNTLLEGVDKALKSSFAINGVIKYKTMLDGGKTDRALEDLTRSIKNNESGFLALDLSGDFIPFKRETKIVDEAILAFIDGKILRNFGVSVPILEGKFTKPEYEAFYQKTLEPIIIRMSQAFTNALFTQREAIGFRHKIVFYEKELVFLDINQKLELVRMLGDSGALTENEKRTLFGLKPLEELVGVRLQSLNYIDANKANTYQVGEESAAPPASGAIVEENKEEEVKEEDLSDE